VPRRFNITGPCVPGRDFMVDLGPRLMRPLQSIRRGESLFLVRSRQSGKTTLLRELYAALRKEPFAVALCAMQLAEDQSLLGLYRHIEATLRQAYPVPSLPKWTPSEPQSTSFCAWLGEAQRTLGRPLVLILDEYDAPPRKLVVAMLRSFRAAMTLSDEARPFLHALVLGGKTHVRDLRDEIRPPGDESRGSGSLWNVALPLVLSPLSRREVDALLDAYAEEIGVPWDRPARDELYRQTRGQPWLVSRIAYLIDEQQGGAEDPGVLRSPPSVAMVRVAAQQIVEEDQVHLGALGDLLVGRREAQELIHRLLGGDEVSLSRTSEAQSYLLDVGLLVPSESRRTVEILCPMYAAYLGRWLSER
jgi:hypothetical protein